MGLQNKPIKTYRTGVLSLSLWENEVEDKKVKSFTFERSYKDDEDNWKNTKSLKVNDLPQLVVLLDKAYRDEIVISE